LERKGFLGRASLVKLRLQRNEQEEPTIIDHLSDQEIGYHVKVGPIDDGICSSASVDN
jgi:hypothetical protein